jgi:hypothetical protein
MSGVLYSKCKQLYHHIRHPVLRVYSESDYLSLYNIQCIWYTHIQCIWYTLCYRYVYIQNQISCAGIIHTALRVYIQNLIS